MSAIVFDISEYLSLFEYVHTERKITGEIGLVIQEIRGHVD